MPSRLRKTHSAILMMRELKIPFTNIIPFLEELGEPDPVSAINEWLKSGKEMYINDTKERTKRTMQSVLRELKASKSPSRKNKKKAN
jgi:hypothetical protein